MHPPTSKFSKLSLSTSGMAPITRSQSQHTGEPADIGGEGGMAVAEAESSFDRAGSDDSDHDEEDDEYDDEGPVRSPLTNLLYSVDQLDDETEEMVREVFRRPAPEETPPMVIEWCGISNDPDVYAFQLQEVVPRTIRIGSPTSRIPQPQCNCMGTTATAPAATATATEKPCRHIVWLMDQIALQARPASHPPDQPLALDAQGLPAALGSAHARIADFHIGVLAQTLHCGAGPPVYGQPNAHRVREAREVLAGLAGVTDDGGVDAYAPGIFDTGAARLQRLLWGEEEEEEEEEDEEEEEEEEEESEDEEAGEGSSRPRRASQGQSERESSRHDRGRRRRHLIARGDLQRTVLRLLVSNDAFFALFLRLLAPHDKARDPFRKIQQRVETVLGELAAVRGGGRGRGAAAAAPVGTGSGSETVSVAWAARHVQHAVAQIRQLLLSQAYRRREGERLPQERGRRQKQKAEKTEKTKEAQRRQQARSEARASATRALVWILHALAFQHNRDAHAGATQDDRNLYQRLIGNAGGSAGAGGSVGGAGDGHFFLLDELALLPDQGRHFREQLERIRARIQVNGYRAPYIQRLDAILAEMRASREEEEEGEEEEDDGSDDDEDDDDDDKDSDSDHDSSDSGDGGFRAGRPTSSTVGAKRQVSGGTGISADREVKRKR